MDAITNLYKSTTNAARALPIPSSVMPLPEGSKAMGVLNIPKWETFAQELAKGETAVKAYALAGYARDWGHATRLAANGSIRARVSARQRSPR
jgi:hypothetical protein